MTKHIISGLLISTTLLLSACGSSGSSTPTSSNSSGTPSTTTNPATAADPSTTITDINLAPISEAEKYMITSINQRRQEGTFCPEGKNADGTIKKVWYPPVQNLAWNSALEAGATAYAQDMITYNYYNTTHANHAGVPFSTRARTYNLLATSLSENTGKGYNNTSADIAELINSWLESTAGHCQTLMDSEMTRIGLGYLTGNGTEYWVADFSN